MVVPSNTTVCFTKTYLTRSSRDKCCVSLSLIVYLLSADNVNFWYYFLLNTLQGRVLSLAWPLGYNIHIQAIYWQYFGRQGLYIIYSCGDKTSGEIYRVVQKSVDRLPYTTISCKGNAIPLQAWTGPEGSRRLRIPDFKTIGTWMW